MRRLPVFFVVLWLGILFITVITMTGDNRVKIV